MINRKYKIFIYHPLLRKGLSNHLYLEQLHIQANLKHLFVSRFNLNPNFKFQNTSGSKSDTIPKRLPTASFHV